LKSSFLIVIFGRDNKCWLSSFWKGDKMTTARNLILASFSMLIVCSSSSALVMGSPTGIWPKTWPKELEPYRTQAKTLSIGTGIQEDVFEIYFQSRQDFGEIWPIILSIKSDGAPLRLKTMEAPSKEKVGLFENTKPMVRIYAPCYDGGELIIPGSKFYPYSSTKLYPYPPWPESVYLPNGKLPEYVKISKDSKTLVPVIGDLSKQPVTGFFFRARIEIELVVDGQIIDLNRIQLPADTFIIDKRTLDKEADPNQRN
jgi:hypothetical protein